MCSNRKQSYVTLPLKHLLCTAQNSGCRFVEVKEGKKKWEKREAVLSQTEADSDLILYLYKKEEFGHKIPLTTIKTLEITKNDGEFTIKIITEKKKKVTFRVNGKIGGMWLAKFLNIIPDSREQTSLNHETHGEYRGGDIAKDLKEWEANLPKNNYTGSQEGFKPPGSDPSGSEPKEKENPEKPKEEANDKSGDKKKESEKKIKSVESNTKLKKTQSNTSKKRKIKTVVKNEAPPPKKDNDSSDEEKKKNQELETSAKVIGATPKPKQTAPVNPVVGLTPTMTPTMTPTPAINEEKPKTKTDSDENEAPENNKAN